MWKWVTTLDVQKLYVATLDVQKLYQWMLQWRVHCDCEINPCNDWVWSNMCGKHSWMWSMANHCIKVWYLVSKLWSKVEHCIKVCIVNYSYPLCPKAHITMHVSYVAWKEWLLGPNLEKKRIERRQQKKGRIWISFYYKWRIHKSGNYKICRRLALNQNGSINTICHVYILVACTP